MKDRTETVSVLPVTFAPVEGHVIVCGFGQVGYHVTMLLQAVGEQVCVISRTGREDFIQAAEAGGATFVRADARGTQSLTQANITNAKALIACTAEDSVNLEIGLDAMHLNPNVRVIVRLFDTLLAERLSELFDMQGFTTATIAGSAFAAAAFGEQVISEFGINNHRYLIVRVDTTTIGSSLVGKTVAQVTKERGIPVVALTTASGTQFAPAPDTIIVAGDVVRVIGEATEFKKIRFANRSVSLGRRIASLIRPINPLRFLWSVWRDTANEVRAAFLAVSTVAAASCFAFAYAFDLSPLDSLYFVITTMTTVGYGDITPRAGAAWHAQNGPPWALALGCILMVNGVIWMVLMYVVVTDYLVSARLEQASSRGGPDEGHTVVVGIGDVGLRTIEDLADANLPVIAIDEDGDSSTFRTAVRKIPAVIGDARDADILHRARVKNADAIIAATADDAANLSIGVAARAINPRIRIVLRIADSQFARKLSASKGLDRLISTPATSAPAFVGAAIHPGSITSFVHNEHLISLVAGIVAGDNPVVSVAGTSLTIMAIPLANSSTAEYFEV